MLPTWPSTACAPAPQPPLPNVAWYELSQAPFLFSHSSAFTRWNDRALLPALSPLLHHQDHSHTLRTGGATVRNHPGIEPAALSGRALEV